MEAWYTPSMTGPLPDARSVLVLAPHPDDETFGCGATIARFRQAGVKVTVCVLTDGAGYVSDAADRLELFNVRTAETQRALACLGVDESEFWGLADRGLAGQVDLSQRVLEGIRRSEASLVLAPSLWEIHPDHLATSRAAWSACAALLALGEVPPTLMLYEVGSPMRPNLLLDSTEVWHKKLAAMQCFGSQLIQQDYSRHITSLNTYRTYTLPADVQFAEAFELITPEGMVDVIRSEDPGRRTMGRWIETAITAAEASGEALAQQLEHQRKDLMELVKIHAEAQKQCVLNQGLLAGQLEAARQDCSSIRAELGHCQNELSEMRLMHARVLASTSWRISAPLRWLSRVLSRLRA